MYLPSTAEELSIRTGPRLAAVCSSRFSQSESVSTDPGASFSVVSTTSWRDDVLDVAARPRRRDDRRDIRDDEEIERHSAAGD